MQNDLFTFVTITFAGDKQVVTISNTDLLQRIYANRMNVAPYTFDHSSLFALNVSGIPKMNFILVAARAYGCAILEQGDCADFGIMTVIAAFQMELTQRSIIHFDLNQ